MTLWNELAAQLEARAHADLKRQLRRVPDGALDLASNDYLGLATHPEVVEAAHEAAARFGAGARASRLVSGQFDLIEDLELALARFKHAEAALVFPSGYAANVGVITALCDENTTLLCHKRNHASLIDGCRLASVGGATVRFWDKSEKLAALLEKSTGRRTLIVADAVFSMDGDLLALPEVLALARQFGATLILDDAHGTGTLGATGRGASEHFEADDLTGWDQHVITVGTLSKALGSQGGFVIGPRVLIDWLVNSARSFIYTTGLNPPAVGAALKSLEIIEREPQRVARCHEIARQLASELQNLGYDARLQPSPILPVMVGEAGRALDLAHQLEAQGLWCPAIRPPTVAQGTARLRLTASAGWNEGHLERIVAGFGRVNSS